MCHISLARYVSFRNGYRGHNCNFPCVLHGCEILSLSRKGILDSQCSRYRVVRRVIEPSKKEITGAWRELRIE
jgi:hypothetical protein